MRIIKGILKNAKIPYKQTSLCRPTRNLVREAIFNLLSNYFSDELFSNNCLVLDVCSGSGGYGFESISRGANKLTLVEKNYRLAKESCGFIEKHNLNSIARILNCNVFNLGVSDVQYNLIFIDPPYENNLSERIFLHLLSKGWFAKHAVIVFELSSEQNINSLKEYLNVVVDKIYSQTKVSICQVINDVL